VLAMMPTLFRPLCTILLLFGPNRAFGCDSVRSRKLLRQICIKEFILYQPVGISHHITVYRRVNRHGESPHHRWQRR
jgi:hypothetical protein